MEMMKLVIGLLIYIDAAVFAATPAPTSPQTYDPCCSFPCENNGVCVPLMQLAPATYQCDCKGISYYGTNCEIPYFRTKIGNWLKPSKDTMHYLLTNFQFVWKIINSISWLRRLLMKAILKLRVGNVVEPSPYGALINYPSWETYSNKSTYVRTLPTIPQICPTPMGVKGKKTLPDATLLVKNFFARKSFTPSPGRTSLVFPLFAQHFSHQFFKTTHSKGLPYQWGQHSIDLSHVYGDSWERQHALRLHMDGKMKYSLIGGEMFPPRVKDANVHMDGIEKVPEKYRFAIGHPGFTLQPPLLFFATIWLREHNRVCNILKEENPIWNDERLFQTARLILTGETMKIVIEDYVQFISGYYFDLLYDPELMHGEGFSYHNEIPVEFQLLYRWHALMPDEIKIDKDFYAIRNLLFNPKPFVESGMKTLTQCLSEQLAGKSAGCNCQGSATLEVAKQAILDGRRLRIQSFNNYRERFGLKRYKSFSEFIDNPEMASDLEDLYEDVDAVEFFVGAMLEKNKYRQIFGPTITNIGSPFSLKGVLSNPIGSPMWWKPSTFGGERGFNIIKSASLQKLVCENVEGCPKVSFQVPTNVNYQPNLLEAFNQKVENTSNIVMKIMRGFEVEDKIMNQLQYHQSCQQETAIQAEVKQDSKSEL